MNAAFALLYGVSAVRPGETSTEYQKLVELAGNYDSLDALRQDVSAGKAPFSRGSKLWLVAVDALSKLGMYRSK